MAKTSQNTKAAVKLVVKAEKANMKYEVQEDLGQFPNYAAAALKAANLREAGRIARAVRKVVYLVETKPRVIH